MILEIAQISVQAGREQQFLQAHVVASEGFGSTDGLLSVRITQGVETPTNFVLLVEWTDVAAHERYRATEHYTRWRAAIGPYVAGPAAVQHTRVVA